MRGGLVGAIRLQRRPDSTGFMPAPTTLNLLPWVELLDRVAQQAAAGGASARFDRLDQPALAGDRSLEQRGDASHRALRMGIRARHLRESKRARDLEREPVFLFGAGAVEDFDRVDRAEDFELRRVLGMLRVDRFRVGIDEREARVELVAERMVRDQDSARVVGHAPELGELVDSADVALEPED